MVQTIDSFELLRRQSDVKFTVLSELSGISYKRVWRFFREDGRLTRQEMARLKGILEDEAAKSKDLVPAAN